MVWTVFSYSGVLQLLVAVTLLFHSSVCVFFLIAVLPAHEAYCLLRSHVWYIVSAGLGVKDIGAGTMGCWSGVESSSCALEVSREDAEEKKQLSIGGFD